MLKRVFYDLKPMLNKGWMASLSNAKYECKALLQTERGYPVAISKRRDKDMPIYRVSYGFSCLFFGSYAEAMAYCRGRFTELGS